MISVNCPCGQAMRLADDLAGKKVRCPLCGVILTLPTADAFLLGGELPYGARAARSSDEGFTHKPRNSQRRKDDDDEDVEEEEEDEKPRKKKKKKPSGPPAVSGKATAALVLGITTCCVPGLFTILTMIFGIIALVEIGKEDKNLTGMGRAITGMVLTIFGNIVAALFYFIFVPILMQMALFGACIGAAVTADKAMKNETTNNLKQIGLGANSFHDANKHMPPPSTKEGLSWRVSILPYIEQKGLFDQIDMKQPWNSPRNQPFHMRRPPTLGSKVHFTAPFQTTFQTTVGPNGFFRNKDEKLALNQVTDGLSNTIYVIDVPLGNVNWMEPVDLTIGNGQPLPPGMRGGQSFLVLMADSSVRTVSRPKIGENVLRQLMDRSDGQGKGADLD